MPELALHLAPFVSPAGARSPLLPGGGARSQPGLGAGPLLPGAGPAARTAPRGSGRGRCSAALPGRSRPWLGSGGAGRSGWRGGPAAGKHRVSAGSPAAPQVPRAASGAAGGAGAAGRACAVSGRGGIEGCVLGGARCRVRREGGEGGGEACGAAPLWPWRLLQLGRQCRPAPGRSGARGLRSRTGETDQAWRRAGQRCPCRAGQGEFCLTGMLAPWRRNTGNQSSSRSVSVGSGSPGASCLRP